MGSKGFVTCTHCAVVLNVQYLKSEKGDSGELLPPKCPVCGSSVFTVEGRWGDSPKH